MIPTQPEQMEVLQNIIQTNKVTRLLTMNFTVLGSHMHIQTSEVA